MSSLKNLYQNNKQGTTVGKYLKSSSPDSVGSGVESEAHLKSLVKKNDYFLPPVDYSKPENFAKFGSAYHYYKNAFEYISSYYPYDGSGLEKTEFFNDINPLEKYTLEVTYPRSTGFITIGSDYGTAYSNSLGYFSSSLNQYVQVKGGPHLNTKFNEAKNRTSNLEFGGPSGSSVEFFLKKEREINHLTESPKQVIFDLTNGVTNSGSSDYGRLRIELVSGSETQFRVTMLSGAEGFNNVYVPSTPGQISISDGTWRNFSFVFDTSGSTGTPSIDFYVNGSCIETGVAGTSNIETVVTGTMIGNIGALRQGPSGSYELTEGAGKLSASIDEFRFWKTARNAEQIGRNWFTNVEGGSDKYDANVSLGVYYKFNEGITENTATDQVVLDYSGRVSNGLFTGYTANCRNTGSAINQLSIQSVSERGDPIIRTGHPDYISTKEGYELTGSTYDQNNSARLLNHLPNWIIEEEEENSNEIVNITQIISSYFDTLHNQLTSLREIKYNDYISGSLTQAIDEFPHNDRLVENLGIATPELFENASVLAQFFKRDEQIGFDQQLVDIKNSIYKNIYNNLNFILKSKGSEKAVRNFIRCLGVGEEVLALNMYSDDLDYEITSSYLPSVSYKKYVDVSALRNQADSDATIYQYYDSTNTNSVGLISGSTELDEYAFSLQSEIIFPNKDQQETLSYDIPTVITSSLFGFHTPSDTSPTSTDLTWASAADDWGLEVYAVKSPGSFAEVVSPQYKVKDAYFIVKNRAGDILLTSSVYSNVFDNKRWNFSLSVKPKRYPFSNGVLNSLVVDTGYELGFYGVNYETGIKKESFNLTSDISYLSGSSTIGSAKRVYAGAIRTNFTGDVLEQTDVRISNARYWTDYISPGVVDLQAKQVDTHGSLHPFRSAYLFQTASVQAYVPSIQTLALNWEFSNITGSDVSGRFIVSDDSYGLNDGSYEATYQSGALNNLSNINLRQHTGRGDFFQAGAKPAEKQYVYADKLLPPDYVSPSDMVKVLSTDDEVFGTFKKPSSSFFAIEKSMYRSISSRMLALFASIQDFNNLIGEPVNKYRMNYKQMEKLREIFFRRVQNDIVDLQKYLDYYKWLDTAMTQMLDQLMPASARYAANVRNIVESHVLERNKIKYAAPLLTEPGSPSRRRVLTGDINGDDTPIGVGGDPGDENLPGLQPEEPNPREQGGNLQPKQPERPARPLPGEIFAIDDEEEEDEEEEQNNLEVKGSNFLGEFPPPPPPVFG
jgi:hypothetical protein